MRRLGVCVGAGAVPERCAVKLHRAARQTSDAHSSPHAPRLAGPLQLKKMPRSMMMESDKDDGVYIAAGRAWRVSISAAEAAGGRASQLLLLIQANARVIGPNQPAAAGHSLLAHSLTRRAPASRPRQAIMHPGPLYTPASFSASTR